MLRLGIVGLPQSGKSTIFAALTGGHRPAALSGRGPAMHVAVVKVPEPRLARLGAMYPGKKLVPAEVEYVDFPYASLGQRDRSEAAWIGTLRTVDTLVAVVPAFQESVLAPEDVSSLGEAAQSIQLELLLNDLPIIERRLERLSAEVRRAKTTERAPLLREQAVLTQLQTELEAGIPVQDIGLDKEAQRLIRGFQLLSAKPVLFVINLGEAALGHAAAIERDFATEQAHRGTRAIALCGQLEMELADLGEEDQLAFRADLGIKELAASRAIRASYQLCGLRSFFTIGDDEIRAWAVSAGTQAPQAAGVVHTDMARGFIRAETIAFDALVGAGDMAAARRQGLLRQEGRSYVVKDGDVLHFLFSR